MRLKLALYALFSHVRATACSGVGFLPKTLPQLETHTFNQFFAFQVDRDPTSPGIEMQIGPIEQQSSLLLKSFT
jgi:hypothetical protein